MIGQLVAVKLLPALATTAEQEATGVAADVVAAQVVVV